MAGEQGEQWAGPSGRACVAQAEALLPPSPSPWDSLRRFSPVVSYLSCSHSGGGG